MENKAIINPSRDELITDFVKSNPDYYIKEFKKIGSKPTYSFSFNLFAFILGPIWFGMRNVWNWTLAFLIIETFSVVQIIRGLFGNITADAIAKVEQVKGTIAIVPLTCSTLAMASAVILPNKPLMICTTEKVSIIKKANVQFQTLRIPNQIGPSINANKLNENE